MHLGIKQKLSVSLRTNKKPGNKRIFCVFQTKFWDNLVVLIYYYLKKHNIKIVNQS